MNLFCKQARKVFETAFTMKSRKLVKTFLRRDSKAPCWFIDVQWKFFFRDDYFQISKKFFDSSLIRYRTYRILSGFKYSEEKATIRGTHMFRVRVKNTGVGRESR